MGSSAPQQLWATWPKADAVAIKLVCALNLHMWPTEHKAMETMPIAGTTAEMLQQLTLLLPAA